MIAVRDSRKSRLIQSDNPAGRYRDWLVTLASRATSSWLRNASGAVKFAFRITTGSRSSRPREDSLTEHDLLDDLLELLRAKIIGIIIKHSDGLTSGVPDVSVSARGRQWVQGPGLVPGPKMTTWYEAKHVTKGIIEQTDLQRVTCSRLAGASQCWYIVWEKSGDDLRTCMVKPASVKKDGTYTVEDGYWVPGYDHQFVLRFIQRVHGIAPYER